MSGSGSSSSAAQQDLLPLISCPLCGKPLLTSIARKGQRPGSRYYKCMDYDDGICSFFEFQDKYARRLAQEPPTAIPQSALPAAAVVVPAGRGAGRAIGRGCSAAPVMAGNPALAGAQEQGAPIGRTVVQKSVDLQGVIAAASLLVGCANLLITIFALGVVLMMYLGGNTQ
ncbi:uncharacterized protein LOC119270300 [Triticum dicoccoides]|uniref:uncharacterized protein LOC119270300 n=1 Tax=Triticum dicoccoides TaxID=85692 RepID=UPI000E7ADCF7|nr:uncharacterized protein LOC119270300 [Triticum dicoccoides]